MKTFAYLQCQFITFYKDPYWICHEFVCHVQYFMRKGSKNHTPLSRLNGRNKGEQNRTECPCAKQEDGNSIQGSQISTHLDSYCITVGSAILNACFRDII